MDTNFWRNLPWSATLLTAPGSSSQIQCRRNLVPLAQSVRLLQLTRMTTLGVLASSKCRGHKIYFARRGRAGLLVVVSQFKRQQNLTSALTVLVNIHSKQPMAARRPNLPLTAVHRLGFRTLSRRPLGQLGALSGKNQLQYIFRGSRAGFIC